MQGACRCVTTPEKAVPGGRGALAGRGCGCVGRGCAAVGRGGRGRGRALDGDCWLTGRQRRRGRRCGGRGRVGGRGDWGGCLLPLGEALGLLGRGSAASHRSHDDWGARRCRRRGRTACGGSHNEWGTRGWLCARGRPRPRVGQCHLGPQPRWVGHEEARMGQCHL